MDHFHETLNVLVGRNDPLLVFFFFLQAQVISDIYPIMFKFPCAKPSYHWIADPMTGITLQQPQYAFFIAFIICHVLCSN